MTEIKATYTIVPDNTADLERLSSILGADYTRLLAQLLEEVKNDTGYGAVEIVVAGGAIQSIKSVKSYRS